jgi:RNA polymerase sigma-70 factor (ECF subfamily)
MKATHDKKQDLALVEKVLSGDEAAAELFLKRYEARIFSFAYRLCGQRQDAEDLTQDTFASAFKHLKGFRAQAPLISWLFRIAAHRCQRMRRLKSGQPRRLVALDAPAVEGGPLPQHPADTRPGAEELLMRGEQKRWLEKAITLLRPEFKLVLVLRDIEGLSNEAVAETLGLSVAAVKSRLHRARMQLKGMLQS